MVNKLDFFVKLVKYIFLNAEHHPNTEKKFKGTV